MAPETSPEWPVQRFGIFYAPPGRRLHPGAFRAARMASRANRGKSPTEQEAFQAAVAEAERFLQVEMDFV